MKYIDYDSAFEEEDKKQAKALKVACNLNNAACKLKLRDYKEAEKLCTKVIFFGLMFWECFGLFFSLYYIYTNCL